MGNATNSLIESIDKLDDEGRALCKGGLDDKAIAQRRRTMSKLLNSALHSRHETLNEADRLYELIDINFNKLSADINKLEDQIRKSGQIDLTDGETNQLVAAAEAALQKRSEYIRKKAVLEEAAAEPPSVEAMLTPSRTRRSNGKPKSSSASRKRKREASYDDPTNPFEPTYCMCERVSFGEMIACDNDRCAREWFHLECVGLNAAPTGKWYCNE